MALYDLTHPLGPSTPVYPGDPPVEVRLWSDLSRGEAYTLRELRLGSHSGTHVDAPAHLLPGGMTLDRAPLELWKGRALLLDLEALPSTDLTGVRRLLIAGAPEGLPREEARRIAEAGPVLVGVDGPSVDRAQDEELRNHLLLLGAGIVLVENLRLAGVPRGWGRIYCLPLLIPGGDGAPARVLWEGSERPCVELAEGAAPGGGGLPSSRAAEGGVP